MFKPAIISDFDGTITEQDSLTWLLNVHGPTDWEKYEDQYEQGKITGAEALENEISLLDIDLIDAIALIRYQIKIRKGFPEFIKWCRSADIPFVIVSCNFKQFITPILEKYDLADVEVFSNELEEVDGRLRISGGKPKHPECDICHNCKALVVKQYKDQGYFTIYIGDGLTDRCAAWEADSVFAHSRLAEHLDLQKLENLPMDGFVAMQNYLDEIMNSDNPPESFYKMDKRDKKKNPFIKP